MQYVSWVPYLILFFVANKQTLFVCVFFDVTIVYFFSVINYFSMISMGYYCVFLLKYLCVCWVFIFGLLFLYLHIYSRLFYQCDQLDAAVVVGILLLTGKAKSPNQNMQWKPFCCCFLELLWEFMNSKKRWDVFTTSFYYLIPHHVQAILLI